MSDPKPRVPLSSTLLGWIVNLTFVVAAAAAVAALEHSGTWNVDVGLQPSPGAALFPDAEAAGFRHSQVTARIPAPAEIRGELSLLSFFLSVAAMYILFDLRQILKSVHRGLGFSRKNADRLRGMACVVLLLGLAQFVSAERMTSALAGLRYANVSLLPRQILDMSFVGIALVLFVLGDVFARAADLQEESDLTV